MVNSMLALTGYTEGPYRLCFNSWYLIDVQVRQYPGLAQDECQLVDRLVLHYKALHRCDMRP